MIKGSLRKRIIALCAASAAVLATTIAAPPAASADTMRTMVLSFSCDTGLPYGLYINVGSGWYSPPGSSYADGITKVFTISIPASASVFYYEPSYCDNQPMSGGYPTYGGYSYSINPGTSTINALGHTADYTYSFYGSTYLLYYCSISSLTYS